jgi:hypothetical protein
MGADCSNGPEVSQEDQAKFQDAQMINEARAEAVQVNQIQKERKEAFNKKKME